jgi:thiol:disulfide interchange protein DsbD
MAVGGGCDYSMIRRVLLAWVAVCGMAGLAIAQPSQSVVKAEMMLATDAVHPNSSARAALVAEVAPGFHINDHHPTLDYLIPTELKLEPPGVITVRDVIYPRGTMKKFAFSDSPLSVYEGKVVVGALLQIARKARPGAYALKGKLTYQACNDHACLPPSTVPLSLDVKVVGRSVPLNRVNADVFRQIQIPK